MADEKKDKPKKLSTKHRAFIAKYFEHYFNGTKAYMDAYGCTEATARANAADLLANTDIRAEIDRRMAGYQVGAEEAIARLAEMMHADLGVFFKVVDEWTFYPLPTYEIIDAKEVVEESDGEDDEPKKRTSYFVRHVVVDMDKVVDPRYSRLLRKFTDSPKSGIGIELHDPQTALDKILRVAGRYNDKVDLTSGGKPITWREFIEKNDPDPDDRSE